MRAIVTCLALCACGGSEEHAPPTSVPTSEAPLPITIEETRVEVGAESLAAAIPDAGLLLFEGSPHPAYLDQPDLFHERLLAFVRSTR